MTFLWSHKVRKTNRASSTSGAEAAKAGTMGPHDFQRRMTYPTQREVYKLIDSNVPTGRGYVSFQESMSLFFIRSGFTSDLHPVSTTDLGKFE